MMNRTRDALVVALLALAVMALFDEWIWPRPLPMPVDATPARAVPAGLPLCGIDPPPPPPGHYGRRRILPPDPRSMT